MPASGLTGGRLAAGASGPSRTYDHLTRIRAEFDQMPGMQLTLQQAQRLFGVDATTCRRLLDELVDARFLRSTNEGRFARNDVP